MSIYYVTYVALVILLCLGIRIAQPNERIAVYRAGRYVSLRNGFTWIIPFVDRTVRIDLDLAVPGWQSLPREDLAHRLEEWLSQNVSVG